MKKKEEEEATLKEREEISHCSNKLFTKQSEDADPLEEGGEGGKGTGRERELVSCTDPHEEGSEEGKATLRKQEVVSCTDPHEEGGEEGKATLKE